MTQMNNTQLNLQEKIVSYMNTGTPLHQVYLMDCLLKVSNAIVQHKDEVQENMKNSPVNPEAWIACAEDAIKHFPEYK